MSSKKPATQIRGDPNQNLQIAEAKVRNFDNQFNLSKIQLSQSPALYAQSRAELNAALVQNERDLQFALDRTNYHKRAILANRNDQLRFRSDLVHLHNDFMRRKEEYEEQIQSLRFQQQEMENKLRAQIDGVIHQLRGLRDFSERRRILIEQIHDIKTLLLKERQTHQEELTDIHHQLLDQRELYENDLRVRLERAHYFAKEFADLHIDTLTKKIMEDAVEKRSLLNEFNKDAIKNLYESDDLLAKYRFLKKQNKILHMNVDKATVDLLDLKSSKKIVEREMNESIQNHIDCLFAFKEEMQEKVADAAARIPRLREENERLKNEAAAHLKEMQEVETTRVERPGFKNETEFLEKVNNASEYVLSALDDRYGKSDDPILLSQKSPMNKLIRRLSIIQTEMKTAPFSSTSTTSYSCSTPAKYLERNLDVSTPINDEETVVKVTKEVQTDKPIRSRRLNGIKAPPTPPTTPRSSTPRRSRGAQHYEFANAPEFRRLAKSGRMPSAFIRIIRSPRS